MNFSRGNHFLGRDSNVALPECLLKTTVMTNCSPELHTTL